jgi:cellulose synthase/poly-beta-1,6-N-acetylglucosamine synthase-like glycosyltransferase
MTVRRSLAMLAPVAVCLLLAGWVFLSVASLPFAGFSILVYALANLIVYTDAMDFALRLYVRRRHTATARGADSGADASVNLAVVLPQEGRRRIPAAPYAVIASVFNLEGDLEEFTDAFAAFRDKMWIVSDGSTDDTVLRLRQAGWRCWDGGANRRKPGALKRLLERLPPHIATVMVVDPDIRILDRGAGSAIDFERFVSDFQRSGAAAACPRIMIEPDGFLARFQAFEYALAFRVGRASLADFSITSGVSLYRRQELQRVLQEHSLSVYAEDLENALIMLGHGEQIYYDGRMVVSTEGPNSVRRWFSQRVGWYHGLIKVYVERFRIILQVSRRSPFAAYNFLLYVGVLSIGLHVLKMVSALLLLLSFLGGLDSLFIGSGLAATAIGNPEYFIAAVGSYLALGVIALFTVIPKAERGYIAPIIPLYLLYAVAHIAPMSVGFANWLSLKAWGRRLYHDHYEPRLGGPVSTAVPEEPARKAA